MNNTAIFSATLPPIQTALNFDGSDGVRVKLDIPEIYVGEAAKLIAMRGKVLRVTVEVESGGEDTEYGGRLK